MARSQLYSVGKYQLGRLKGEWVVVWRDGATRRRYRLEACSEEQARQALDGFARGQDLIRAKDGHTVQHLWNAYIADRRLENKRSVPIMEHNWKALKPRFGHLAPSMISKALCMEYAKSRAKDGLTQWSIVTELRRLSNAMNWSAKHGLIERAPVVWRPQEPRGRERWLTKDEVARLINSARAHHIKLYIILAISTAARPEALLTLTWDRVDMDAGLIFLDDPTRERTNKGRATVPINDTAKAALSEARAGALTPYVIEYAHDRVRSMKKGFADAVKRSGIDHCTPNDLRRTAASWMVMAGIPIEVVARYLGHSNPRITYRIYGRFAPDYLKDASKAVNLDLRRAV